MAGTNLSEAIKEIIVPSRLEDGNRLMPASAIFPVDPNVDPIQTRMPCVIQDPTTPGLKVQVFQINPTTALNPSQGIGVYALKVLSDTAAGSLVAQRTSLVYKNVTTLAAGSTAIWTSAVGKRWRLMGVCVTLMQGTTAAAACNLRLLDVAADTGIGVTISIGALAAVPNTAIILVINDMGNGILAAATNTALNVNLSSVMAVGGVSVQVWGCEE